MIKYEESLHRKLFPTHNVVKIIAGKPQYIPIKRNGILAEIIKIVNAQTRRNHRGKYIRLKWQT